MNRWYVLMIFGMMLFASSSHAAPDTKEIYRLIMVDSTGSMSAENACTENPDGTGDPQNRMWCAKRDSKIQLYPFEEANRFYGVYNMNEFTYGMMDLNEDGDKWSTLHSEITSTVDTIDYELFSWTNMADLICDAMGILKSMRDDNASTLEDQKDQLYLYVYTDGQENISLPGNCGNFNDQIDNDNPFVLDGRNAWDPDNPTNEVIDSNRTWAPLGSDFSREGRAYIYEGVDEDGYYQPYGEYDWAGGVLPESWEWRVYYKVAWDDEMDETVTGVNKLWYTPEPPALKGDDVILKIQEFFRQVQPGETLKAAVADPRIEPLEGEAFGVRIALAADAPMVMAPTGTFDHSEDALFAGLAALTKGKVVRVGFGENAPLDGDLDLDGDVDDTDRQAVYTWFGRPVDYYNQGSIDADINLDRFIDNADMAYIRANWTDLNKYPPIVGDTDYNWCVDNGDLSKIWQWFGKTPGPGDQAFYYADINADGKVNWADYFALMAHWQEGCGTNGIPTCYDGIQYGEETDIDCGGSICNCCGDGRSCIINDDCLSNVCFESVCEGGGTPPTGINLGPVNSETHFTVNGSQALYIDQLTFPGWTPSNIVIGFGDTNGLSLNGITVSVDGGAPIYLSGYWQTVSVPFTYQSVINITVNSATSHALRTQWWAS